MSLAPGRTSLRQLIRVSSTKQTRKLSRCPTPRRKPSYARIPTQWLSTVNRTPLNRRQLLTSVFGSQNNRESFPEILEFLSDASRKLELRIRPPPRSELVEKLDAFFSKIQSRQIKVTDYHVSILRPLLDYVLAQNVSDTSVEILRVPKWMAYLGISPKRVENEMKNSIEESGNITNNSNLASLADSMVWQLKEASRNEKLAANIHKVLKGLEPEFQNQEAKKQSSASASDETLVLLSGQLILMRNRLRSGDFDNAVAIWDSFDSETLGYLGDKKNSAIFEVSAEEVVGELIRAIVRPGYDIDVDLLKSLKSWTDTFVGRYDSETLSSLVCYNLLEEEYKLAIEDIKSSIPYMSSSQRLSVVKNLEDFGFHRLEASDIETAWHVCNFLMRLFPDVPRATMVHFMTAFLNYGQVEYGMHIFQFMRNSHRPDRRPNEDVYLELLQALARNRPGDSVALRRVHNQLKIDTNVEPSTNLYNTVMASYLQAGLFDNGLGLWEQFELLEIEPTLETYKMAILLTGLASTTTQRDVDELWKQIESKGIDEGNPGLLCTYIGTLAFNGRKLFAMNIIRDLKFTEGLSSLYYASMDDAEVHQWIESEYPDEMAQVLNDKATEEVFAELVTARLRGQGLYDDDMDHDKEESQISR